jgi:hypothetical protein
LSGGPPLDLENENHDDDSQLVVLAITKGDDLSADQEVNDGRDEKVGKEGNGVVPTVSSDPRLPLLESRLSAATSWDDSVVSQQFELILHAVAVPASKAVNAAARDTVLVAVVVVVVAARRC